MVGGMTLRKEQLKERASSLVEIPAHYQLVIEEYHEDGEAIFSWTDQQQEEGVSVTLDLTGNLTSLSIERNKTYKITSILDRSELKEQAEKFLSSHYPDALQALTHSQTEQLTDGYRFTYEQLVMDLPLAHAGCFIDVEPGGEIVKFHYYGIQPKPIIPEVLIEKEKLIEHVQSRLDLQLTITNLNSAIYNVEEDGLRLVYDVELFMNYKAGVAEPTLSIIHEEDSPEEYVSLPSLITEVRRNLSAEEIIGITEEMGVIRKVDLGEETGIVWRDLDWRMEEKDLSLSSFLQHHNEDTVKAFLSNETGKVRSFMWFKERSGDLLLSRDECYQKAIDFLQMLIPNEYQYLHLIVRDDDELDNPKGKEVFTFQVQNSQGIRIYLEIVIVAVNRQTGQIDHYSGPSFDFEQLHHIPSEPVITKEEAHDTFLKSLDFELAWHKNFDEKEDGYTLVYQDCDRHTRKSIRYIDAITGAVITTRS